MTSLDKLTDAANNFNMDTFVNRPIKVVGNGRYEAYEMKYKDLPSVLDREILNFNGIEWEFVTGIHSPTDSVSVGTANYILTHPGVYVQVWAEDSKNNFDQGHEGWTILRLVSESEGTGVGNETTSPLSKDLSQMGHEVHRVNMDKGWFDKDRTFGEDIALLHSEVSEALDAYRKYGLEPKVGPNGKPEGVGSELADVLIRLLDTCDRYNVILDIEYEAKMAYNRTRPYRHGGRRL